MRRLFKKTKTEPVFPLSLDSERGWNTEIYHHLNSVIKLDMNGNLVSFNEVFSKQFGYKEQDFKEPFLDVFIKNETFEKNHFFEKALLGKTQTFNALGLRTDGNSVAINVTLIPIKDKMGMSIYVIIKNITESQEQEKELFLLQKKLEAFNELEDICNFHYDAINDIHYLSKQFSTIFGISAENNYSPTHKQLLQYIHPDDRALVNDTIQTALSEKTGYQIEYRLLRKDQTVRYVYEQAEILLDKKGYLDGLIGFIQDITDRKISDHRLETEEQLTKLYGNPDIGIWSINVQTGQILNYSKGIECLSGYTIDDFNNGVQWFSIIHQEDIKQYTENQVQLELGNVLQHQYRIIHKNGDIRWVQDYTIPTLDNNGKLIQLDGLTLDMTEEKGLKEKIKYLSEYDPLTKLPNRQKFIIKLQELIDEYSNSHHPFAVMKLDIDRFKYVNDTLGNQIGDEVLVQISDRLSKHLSPHDMLARRGGDEFMILIRNIESIESLKIAINEMVECLNAPFYIEEYQLFVTASIGIVTYPENGESSLELLRNANLALSKAQKDGKNNYKILSHSSSIQSFKIYSIGRDLKKAIENNEMTLYFQPRVDAQSNQIISAEALIRWNHPQWGLISPHEFLTLAEENGLITDIDDWVLNEVCNQIKQWKNKKLKTVPISINISAVHFMKQDWPSTVATVLKETGIHPHDIELEITESTVLNNMEMVQSTIDRLRLLGIKIAIDDFGKGYSSLSYLTQYSFDVIKIDKSFIRNMHRSDKDLHLAKSIIYMAKGLQLKVVAEGVETLKQLITLQNEQCNEIQGYLFSHPVPVDEFETLLQKKILLPIDPELKAKQNRRNHDRLEFLYPLEAEMRLVSIAGRNMELGKSNVLVKDISIGGLRYISTLKLPVRGDVLFQFETEILGKVITLNGSIVWKEEINEDLIEYGIKFMIGSDEQAALSNLLHTLSKLLKNSTNTPPYRMVTEDTYQYFK